MKITLFLLYFVILILIPCSSSFSCGNLDIRCPFFIHGRSRKCRSQSRELLCENNRTTVILFSNRFYIMGINYTEKWIRVIDPGLEKDSNCSSMPQHSLTFFPRSDSGGQYYVWTGSMPVVYMSCSKNLSDSPGYLSTSACVHKASVNMLTYVIVDPAVSEFKNSCTNILTSWVSVSNKDQNSSTFRSYSDLHKQMMKGFRIYYPYSETEQPSYLTVSGLSAFGVLFIMRFILTAPLAIPFFLIYSRRKRNRAMNGNIEDFLDMYGDQMPMRYSYNDVKRMTSNFKEKLGQGGFGSVYKGSLRNRPVAIKILTSTKGEGQDFINEVATMGKIHHVNVVQLIGFVAERWKQALVYELMPNGSLEKYLFPHKEGKLISLLSWEKTYEIALGIARGIEYLHRGCGMRILHFDIKPHNILLDENYNPKVSDFGLARSYSMDASIVSVTQGVRGTIGYMAPEFFYRSLGNVSYKSDVYSFGMLLMEMAGRRKNLNTSAENASQIYFPLWIYRQLKQRKDIEMEDATQEENEIAQKLFIVALWCIQLKPVNRPSMTKVVEMLEGELGLLQVPDKPLSIADWDEDEHVMLNSLVCGGTN